MEHQIINQRCYTMTPLEDTKPEGNLIFDLAYLGGVSVVGENAAQFLQGQLTCDVLRVCDKTAQFGALCDLKGRVQVLVDIVDWSGMWLVMPHDLAISTQRLLHKAALFSKVEVSSSTKFRVFGFKLNQSDAPIPFSAQLPQKSCGVVQTNSYCCYHVHNNLYIFLVKLEAIPELSQQFSYKYWRGSHAWHKLQLQSSRVEIYPCSQGLFLPHNLGLQNLGYLSFDKGCYKGQEIIARMHYRAKLKYSLQLITLSAQDISNLNSAENLTAGQILHDNQGVKLGEIVDYAIDDNKNYLIAIINT